MRPGAARRGPWADTDSVWFIQALVRSQAQVFFQRSTRIGVLVILGLAVASAGFAVLALLGAAAQTTAAYALRRRAHRVAHETGGSHPASALAMSGLSTDASLRRDAAEGIHGFCGALTGCAAFLSCGASWAAGIWTVVGALLCAVVIRAVEQWRFLPWLPMLTGPFCLVSSALNPLFAPWRVAPPAPEPLMGALLSPAIGTVRAAAQVLLTDHFPTGIVVLAAMFLAGWREGTWALVGALLATLLGLAVFGPDFVSLGLAGYSGFLTALALGAVFPTPEDDARAVQLLVPLIGACLTVPVQWVLLQTGIAVYTWPFVLVTWAGLTLRRAVQRRRATPAAPPAP